MSEGKDAVITSNALQLRSASHPPANRSSLSPFNFHLKQNSCHRLEAKNSHPFQLPANEQECLIMEAVGELLPALYRKWASHHPASFALQLGSPMLRAINLVLPGPQLPPLQALP